jgi:small-conductance mechanosensitive channel
LGKLFERRFKNSDKADRGRIESVRIITNYFLWTIAIVLILNSLSINITLLLAGSAALLVGIGFGIQQTFNDFVSGIIILFEGTIQVGDVVQVSEFVGTVREIGIRTSRVETVDKIWVIVPNSKFVTDNVVNWSKNDFLTRFKVTVGVAYGSDTEKVQDILVSIAMAHPLIEKEPVPFVEFNDFGDSALLFNLMYYTKEVLPLWRIKSDLRFAIDKAFREQGIIIPFPQRDVYIRNA